MKFGQKMKPPPQHSPATLTLTPTLTLHEKINYNHENKGVLDRKNLHKIDFAVEIFKKIYSFFEPLIDLFDSSAKHRKTLDCFKIAKKIIFPLHLKVLETVN